MSKKTLIQILLGLIIIFILVFSYTKFFNQKNSDQSLKENIEVEDTNDAKGDVIEGIEYISNDNQGNIYIVKAKNGKNESENTNLITLYNVEAILKFDKKKKITVTSNKAIYNTLNNNTDFMNDVIVVYGKHNIFCDKIIANFSENYAKLFGNLIYNNDLTKLYADQMEIDLFNRTSKTSMFNKKDKVKIIKKNGIN
tara:strand:+ start:746 stop:1336 length:591 start_codon:yes stop_codon:yes gene_type:complete